MHEPALLDAHVSVHGFAPKLVHGVPGVFPAQLVTHVAAASAGVGATMDATAGSRIAAARPTRRATSRRLMPAESSASVSDARASSRPAPAS